MTPHRIQRKRTKGWKMPPNTVCVTRGTPYGNPFRVGGGVSASEAVQRYAIHMASYFSWVLKQPGGAQQLEDFLAPIRGKNLACYCKPDEPCHADVLLKLANQTHGGKL